MLMVFMFRVVPTGFVPEEDQGYFIGIVQAPDGAFPGVHQAGHDPGQRGPIAVS